MRCDSLGIEFAPHSKPDKKCTIKAANHALDVEVDKLVLTRRGVNADDKPSADFDISVSGQASDDYNPNAYDKLAVVHNAQTSFQITQKSDVANSEEYDLYVQQKDANPLAAMLAGGIENVSPTSRKVATESWVTGSNVVAPLFQRVLLSAGARGLPTTGTDMVAGLPTISDRDTIWGETEEYGFDLNNPVVIAEHKHRVNWVPNPNDTSLPPVLVENTNDDNAFTCKCEATFEKDVTFASGAVLPTATKISIYTPTNAAINALPTGVTWPAITESWAKTPSLHVVDYGSAGKHCTFHGILHKATKFNEDDTLFEIQADYAPPTVMRFVTSAHNSDGFVMLELVPTIANGVQTGSTLKRHVFIDTGINGNTMAAGAADIALDVISYWTNAGD